MCRHIEDAEKDGASSSDTFEADTIAHADSHAHLQLTCCDCMSIGALEDAVVCLACCPLDAILSCASLLLILER